MKLTKKLISKLLEAALFVEGKPISAEKLRKMLPRETRPPLGEIREVLAQLQKHYESRGVQLVEVASGFRFQACEEIAGILVEQQEVKPMRFSKAFMETLALVAYRQPITRGEIEDIRGVAVSPNIIKSLQELEWIREVGHKDVPGKPALFATTRKFLDFFNLKSLSDLPPLAQLEELTETRMSEEYEQLDKQLSFEFEKANILDENAPMGPFLPGQEPWRVAKPDQEESIYEQVVPEEDFDVLASEEVQEHQDQTVAESAEPDYLAEEWDELDELKDQEETSEAKIIEQDWDLETSKPPSKKPNKSKNVLEEDWGELDDFDDQTDLATDADISIQSEMKTKEFDEVESEASASNHRPLEEFSEIVLTRSSDDSEDDTEEDTATGSKDV